MRPLAAAWFAVNTLLAVFGADHVPTFQETRLIFQIGLWKIRPELTSFRVIQLCQASGSFGKRYLNKFMQWKNTDKRRLRRALTQATA